MAGGMRLILVALLAVMPGRGDTLVDWIVTPSYAMCVTPKIGSSMFLEFARWVALDDATVGNSPTSARAWPHARAGLTWRSQKLAHPTLPDATGALVMSLSAYRSAVGIAVLRLLPPSSLGPEG